MNNVIKRWFYKKFNMIRVRDLPAVCLSELNISKPVEKLDVLDKRNIRWISFLESINDKKCQIRHAMNVARVLVLLPMTLGLMLGFCFFINDFLKGWSANEKMLFKFVEYSKEKYGEQFFLNPTAPEYTNLLKIIADDKEVSFFKYLYIRYSKNSLYREDRSKQKLITDGGFLFFFIVSNVLCVRQLFFKRRPAPLVIDRDRNLFYTWYKGGMYVARYEEIGVIHSSNILYLKLYGLDKSNKLISYVFVPSVSMFSFAQLSSESEKLYMLIFISMYLLKGKASVSAVDLKKQASLLWQRKNPKPINWESQAKNILAELDKFGPPDVLVSINDFKEKNIK